MKPKTYILPIIIFSQFACTSLWFAGNAILDQLITTTGLENTSTGIILSAVQFGFIIGTLTFALLLITDRFSPSKVFFCCAILAAFCNIILLLDQTTKVSLLVARFGTGFFLAGIYPVGMKIAADYYNKGLGKALGFLVGALVFGSSLPYFISSFTSVTNYKIIVIATSSLAIFGGILLWLLVPNGPYRKTNDSLKFGATPALFKKKEFKSAAIGYFGHMWELYAFWAFTPLAIKTYNNINTSSFSIPLTTAIIIALGGVSCFLGGYLSQKVGSYKIAISALSISGFFCLCSPFLFLLPSYAFILAWGVWGMAITADSPQFSSLVATSAPNEIKGTALTIVNCIGFAISIISIELLSFLKQNLSIHLIFISLAIGPIVGVASLYKRKKQQLIS